MYGIAKANAVDIANIKVIEKIIAKKDFIEI